MCFLDEICLRIHTLHQQSAVVAVLKYEEELTILFTSTNGLPQSPFPALVAGGSISFNENLMECSQTFPLYLYRGRDPRGQQVRNNELFDFSSSLSLKSCPAPLRGAPCCHQGQCPQQSHSSGFQPPHNTFPAVQVSASDPKPEFSLLRGVPLPTNLLIRLVMDVFVSECCSVNVTHCMNPGNNGGSSQHPRSFPTPNKKTHS